jgi:hypothetical protein
LKKNPNSGEFGYANTPRFGTTENVNAVMRDLADDNTILAFKLLSLKAGYTYEITGFISRRTDDVSSSVTR